MIARLRILALACVVSICAPSLSHAQQTNASRAHPTAGPRREVTATAVRLHAQSVDSTTTTTLAAPRKNMGQPIALMVVGGAAIILGAVIGGDAGTLFMIGGAVAGLIGLYQYLQ